MALLFRVSEQVVRADATKENFRKTKAALNKALNPWKADLYFGDNQRAVHACMGLLLQKNILEIDVYGSAADGLVNAGARAAMRAPTTPRAPKCAWPGCPARSCPSITAYCPRVP